MQPEPFAGLEVASSATTVGNEIPHRQPLPHDRGVVMHAQLKNGSLRLCMGRRFGTAEAERVCEAARASAPLRRLTLDFTDVRDFEPPVCTVVAKMLSASVARKVVLLGVTPGQSRMLKCMGVECARSEPGRT